MKTINLKLMRSPEYAGELFTVGNTYTLTERWTDYFMVQLQEHEICVKLSDFQTPLELLFELAATSPKLIVTGPDKTYRVTLELTESYIVVYSHSKGNHWNISGNHYKYYHSRTTGEFISESLVKKEPVIIKQALLKADFLKVKNIYASNLNRQQ
jgi:hypothetical protein